MKKLILFLLLPLWMLGQTSTGQEQEFDYGIKNNSTQTITTPPFLGTFGTDGTQGKIPAAYIATTQAMNDSLAKKLNISDLPANLTLYPTTTASDVSGYVVLVKDIHDPRYNSTAVDVSTPAITGTAQLISQRISDAGVLTGNPGVFNVTTFGNIRKVSGSGTAQFYFEIYHRDSAGTETLICTSSVSEEVINGTYAEFSASGVWDNGAFSLTDRIVTKTYANRIAGGSDPVYQLQFGGSSPVRTVLPVPFTVLAGEYEIKANKSDSYTTSSSITYATTKALVDGLSTKPNDADVVHKAGNETISGNKTFTNSIVGTSANFSGTFTVIDPVNPYNATTKNYVDSALNLKANQSTTYTKSEVDSKIANLNEAYHVDFIDSGTHNFTVPSDVIIQNVYLNNIPVYGSDWSQTTTTVTVSASQTGDKVTLTGGKYINSNIYTSVDSLLRNTGVGVFKTLGSTIPSASETQYNAPQKFFVINDLTAISKSNLKNISINHGTASVGTIFYVAVVSINSGVLTIREKVKLITTGTNSIQNYNLDLVMNIGDKIAISTTDKLARFESGTGGGYFVVMDNFSLIDNTSSNLNFGVSIDVEEVDEITLDTKIVEGSEENRVNVVYNFTQDLTLATSTLATETQAFANLNWIDYTDAVRLKIHKSGSNLVKFYKITHGNTVHSLVETIDVSKYNEGEIVVIKFKNQIAFEKGEYLAISSNLYYKNSGGNGVISVNSLDSTPVFEDANNNFSIGFQLLKLPTKTIDTNKINLIGKKISILGDSISTFEGFIPTENEKFYPITWDSNFDVLSVEDTWWKKLINETGLVLDVNNSWSGSRITNGVNLNNESVQRKAFVTDDRLNNLGNPDYIIVFGGTNDYGNYSIPFGVIEKDPADWDLGVITHAYQYMVYELQERYPKSKIILCSPIQRAISAETGFYPIHRWAEDLYLYQLRDRIEEISKIYGTEFVDLFSCGITYFNSKDSLGAESLYLSDGLHPKESGMELIKNLIITKLK